VDTRLNGHPLMAIKSEDRIRDYDKYIGWVLPESRIMDEITRKQIVSIIDDVDDMTIATVRDDLYPQATTVSYVNEGLTIFFGTSPDSQKVRNLAKNDRVSLTINRGYGSWGEIEGLSISGRVTRITDPAEQQKAGELLFAKFPQIAEYVPADEPLEDVALFRVEPEFISLIDYRKEFGHCELVHL
jgi:nitroimidazol reductase NimA-like FMN-containing flavoprotein (pyridoxamine 5'-phosphate oxidase superfamily)